MKPTFFSDQLLFRAWLETNHETASELLVGYYKVGSGKPSMTWPESVDQALCFGWIDGIRRTIDGESYCIRFTPRKPKSNWSAVNIAKIAELLSQDLMKPAGIAAFERRTEDKSAIYAYENKPTAFDADLEALFRANPSAWEFFERQPNGYRRTLMYWVMSAKQAKTRNERMAKLIEASDKSERLR
ncbi:MAG: YdeI/OmpD-associated family protein [Acidobacteria bacterium]|nr:YdeI/OmpD-associated family protein [Acidobacteriota bacterium]